MTTKLLASPVSLLLDLGPGRGKLAFALLDAVGLALRNDLVGAGMRLVENTGGLMTRAGDDFLGFRLSPLELLLASVGSGQAFLNLGLT